MVSISKLHSKFVEDLIGSAKLFQHFYSILPSVLFLASIFALLYIQFNKHNDSRTSWKAKLCKDVVFHWTYFYTSRIWFMFVKLARWIMQYSDKAIEKNSKGDEVYYNKIVTHFCVFVFVLSISLVPGLILFIRYFNRREMPNFLMWVAEDPWVRSEIGTSGHYLERPPRAEIYGPQKHTASYRSGRSSSVDTNVYLEKHVGIFRTCKSAISLKKSCENVVG